MPTSHPGHSYLSPWQEAEKYSLAWAPGGKKEALHSLGCELGSPTTGKGEQFPSVSCEAVSMGPCVPGAADYLGTT